MTPSHFVNRYTIVLAAILVVQGFDTFALGQVESRTAGSFLERVPHELNGWAMTDQVGLDVDVQSALQPDDYLARYYTRQADGKRAELVIAYFKSQREGFGPHSPRVCLPAAGWMPVLQTTQAVRTGTGESVTVNYFIIRKNGRNSAVLYWYQTPRRTTAGEIPARMWLALDTLTSKRSDVSLVRITVPMPDAGDHQAVQAAAELSQAVHGELGRLWQ